jgi:hypothetical protein
MLRVDAVEKYYRFSPVKQCFVPIKAGVLPSQRGAFARYRAILTQKKQSVNSADALA